VHFDALNVQTQPSYDWPPSPVVARAYLDQLEREDGLVPDQISSVRSELERAEGLAGQAQRDALNALYGRLKIESQAATDAAKVLMLNTVINQLAHPEGASASP
jgi:hypothetical protein